MASEPVRITIHESVEIAKFDGEKKDGDQPVEIVTRERVRTVEIPAESATPIGASDSAPVTSEE